MVRRHLRSNLYPKPKSNYILKTSDIWSRRAPKEKSPQPLRIHQSFPRCHKLKCISEHIVSNLTGCKNANLHGLLWCLMNICFCIIIFMFGVSIFLTQWILFKLWHFWAESNFTILLWHQSDTKIWPLSQWGYNMAILRRQFWT